MGTTAIEDQETSISGAQALTSATTRTGKKRAITGFGVAMLLVLAFAIFCYLNFKTVEVQGRSMFPTFKTGQRVLTSKAYWLVGPIRDNDVVVLTDTGPTGYIIKRVMWSGGETVNWKWVPENWHVKDGPFVVPPGHVYVLGDNRPESEDSRKFGPRKVEDIIGKVLVR